MATAVESFDGAAAAGSDISISGPAPPSEVMPLTSDGHVPPGYMINADGTNLVRIPAGFEISPDDPQKMIPRRNTTPPTGWDGSASLGNTQVYRTNTGSSNFRYDIDNLDLTYHAVIPDDTIYDVSMNYVRVQDPSGNATWIPRAPPQAPPFYYDLGTPKYDPALFVPTYAESRIMSHVRGAPTQGRTAGVEANRAVCNQAGLCYARPDAGDDAQNT